MTVDIEDIKLNPILFCSNECLDSFLFEIEKKDHDLNYEDPKEVKKFARNLMDQVERMQKEIKVLSNIRTGYFEILKGDKLKTENYKRKWSFRNKQK